MFSASLLICLFELRYKIQFGVAFLFLLKQGELTSNQILSAQLKLQKKLCLTWHPYIYIIQLVNLDSDMMTSSNQCMFWPDSMKPINFEYPLSHYGHIPIPQILVFSYKKILLNWDGTATSIF